MKKVTASLLNLTMLFSLAAWPVNDCVKNNDFTGKTVIPFCTFASSGLGESGTLLAEMAGTGDWQTGMRFSSNASEDDVTAVCAALTSPTSLRETRLWTAPWPCTS